MRKFLAIAFIIGVGGFAAFKNARQADERPAHNVASDAGQHEPTRVPCSFRTPGLQYACVEPNGKMRPAGPAWARQEKYFADCRARGEHDCLARAAKVK